MEKLQPCQVPVKKIEEYHVKSCTPACPPEPCAKTECAPRCGGYGVIFLWFIIGVILTALILWVGRFDWVLKKDCYKKDCHKKDCSRTDTTDTSSTSEDCDHGYDHHHKGKDKCCKRPVDCTKLLFGAIIGGLIFALIAFLVYRCRRGYGAGYVNGY